MYINGKTLTQSRKFKSDVCVLGGGVAGITLANELSKKGLTVCLLEAGGESRDPIVQSQAKAASVPTNYPDPSQSRLRMLGGTSNHWANNTSPFSPIDFEEREGFDESGWPIKYPDLAPYYIRAGEYCGVGVDGYGVDYWHDKFKSTPTISKENNAIKLAMAKASIPPTRFFNKFGGTLKADENVTVISYAQVVDISYSEKDSSINSVEFRSPNNMSHTVESGEYIMAFGGLENARMLLHFNDKNQNKLGNQGGCVGAYFMDHPTLRGAQLYTTDPSKFSLFKGELPEGYNRFVLNFFELSEAKLKEEQITNVRLPLVPATRQQLSHGISSLHILRERLSGKPMSGDLASHITNVVMDFDVVADTISRKNWDTPLFDGVNEQAGFEIPLMMEQTPYKENKVTLSNRRDKHGIPLLNINWRITEKDKERLWRAIDIFGLEVAKLGLGRVRSLKDRASRLFDDQIGFGHHHMGTTRMSESPKNGVVDSEQRVFGVTNLSMAGSSVFSTGGHVPPTLTIVATSIRLSEIVAKRLSKGLNNEA